MPRGGGADLSDHALPPGGGRLCSGIYNKTLPEYWTARHDSNQQWSHCPVVPVYITYHTLAGIRPLTPGFARAEIRPQLADLTDLSLTAHTMHGPICFKAAGRRGDRQVALAIPPGCSAELLLPRGERVDLAPAAGDAPAGLRRYALPSGRTIELHLRKV